MAKTGALFSEGDAGRIARAVKKVEAQAGGESGKRPRRVAGIATFLWAKLTSDFDSGAANTLKGNPCDADGGNTLSEIGLVLYVELPTTGTPDRSCFSASNVLAYMPYVFRDADGNETADGFLVSAVCAAGLPVGTGVGQVLYWDNANTVWVLTAALVDYLNKDYVLLWDHNTETWKPVEVANFTCPQRN